MGWIVLAMVVALRSSAPPPAQQRADTRAWYQAYADGRRAFQQGNWQAAVDSLEASKRAAGAPKPGRRVPFYGDVYDDYIPDYYLGLAYFNLRQYAAADRALEAMRASGVIGPRDREYAQLDQQSKAAKVALQAANAPVQQQTPATVAPGNAANANTTAPVAAPPPGTTPPVTPPPIDVSQTAPSANTNAGVRPPAGLTGSTGATGSTGSAATPPAGYRPPPNAAPNAGVNVRPPRPVVTPPAATPAISIADEQAAVTAYLSGQYDQTARLLASAAGGAGVSPRSTFYLACSRAALVILGQADPASLTEARAALARAGGALQFTADRRYISPRVLQMIEGTP
jgi:hypothetical protein